MTIYDENRSLTFDVIGYENEEETDGMDWLMLRYTYTDGEDTTEFYDPSVYADELKSLYKELDIMLSGKEKFYISNMLDEPAFQMAVIESNGKFAVALHVTTWYDGKISHNIRIRETMSRERFEEFVADIENSVARFPERS